MKAVPTDGQSRQTAIRWGDPVLGSNIRTLRKARKMSQGELAELFGVSVNAVSKWEKGVAEPNVERLTAMAELFGVTLDELCGELPSPDMSTLKVMNRAFAQMTPDEQEKLLAVGRALFAHAFEGLGE